MSSSEEDAEKLRKELESGQDVEGILRRVKDSIYWTPALAQSTAGKALLSMIRAAPPTAMQQEAKGAYHTQLREAKIASILERWWSYPPVPAGASDAIELSFVDATDEDECWEPERVACSSGELFAHASQRFRVSANKKYRHPFLPSMHFDLLLDDKKRAPFDSFDSHTVADVIGDKREIRYVRNDTGRAQREEQEKSPARSLLPWNRARIFPSWCTTPDSWFEPVPPPGFSAPSIRGEQYYLSVPTLHIPGAGILPATLKPQLISRTLYLPVRDLVNSGQTVQVPLNQEEDYVPLSNRLVPSALTVDTARSLLGRCVQSSSEPARDDAPPMNKKRKTSPENKYATRTVAFAWGLTLDSEGRPDWLHCVQLLDNAQYDLVLDLKGQLNRQSRANVRHANCAWVGAVVLDADLRAQANTKKEDQDQDQEEEEEEEEGRKSYGKWADKTEEWIKNLNKEGVDKLVEVGQDGTLLAGDVESAKGDGAEFELLIAGAKPGIWRMTVSTPMVVHFVWVREGAVDYDALPTLSAGVVQPAIDENGLEELGRFTVDSGKVALFSQRVFESLTSGDEREAKIETLIDARMEGRGDEEYVPGGVVVHGDDGSYVVEGTRDGDGMIVSVRMRPLE